MKKLLRISIVILLIVIVAAVVYTQRQIYMVAPVHPGGASKKVALIAAGHPSEDKSLSDEAGKAVIATVAPPPVPTPVLAALGTDASPVVVKLTEMPEQSTLAAEREKDRETLRGMEHYLARMAATSLAQNFLFLFQAIIYFLMLIVIYLLLENVRKFADAATKSAEAAKKSAEMAEAAAARHEHKHKPHIGPSKMPPYFYRKR